MLKGEHCLTEKCAFERRPYAPGQHGQARVKVTDYGIRLREKQKVRRLYGILEKQFHHYFVEADRMKGVTGETLLQLLEGRLDNVTYRMGFATTRREARQLVRHSHFLVNDRKVNIPSYQVRPGDVVTVREKSRTIKRIQDALEGSEGRIVEWLEVDAKAFSGTFNAIPTREQLTVSMEIREQLIVELYSK